MDDRNGRTQLTSISQGTTFRSVYARTTNDKHAITVKFSKPAPSASNITIQTGGTHQIVSKVVPASSSEVTLNAALIAGANNTVTIWHHQPIESIQVTSPEGTYYPGTDFTLTGDAQQVSCGEGFCKPVGSKVGYLSPNSTARATIPGSAGAKYVEIDYINNEVAFDSAWGWGTNTRNITIAVNGGQPIRLDAPLSGQHSELYGPGKGWWDTATLGVLTSGWKDGDNEVVLGNVGGEKGFQSYAADFVGLRVFG